MAEPAPGLIRSATSRDTLAAASRRPGCRARHLREEDLRETDFRETGVPTFKVAFTNFVHDIDAIPPHQSARAAGRAKAL